MSIQGIGGSSSGFDAGGIGLSKSRPDESGSFEKIFQDLVQEANQTAGRSDQLVEQLARGEPTDIHSVMVAMSEADLSFRMLVEVRNRLIDSYQEIQRMPV